MFTKLQEQFDFQYYDADRTFRIARRRRCLDVPIAHGWLGRDAFGVSYSHPYAKNAAGEEKESIGDPVYAMIVDLHSCSMPGENL